MKHFVNISKFKAKHKSAKIQYAADILMHTVIMICALMLLAIVVYHNSHIYLLVLSSIVVIADLYYLTKVIKSMFAYKKQHDLLQKFYNRILSNQCAIVLHNTNYARISQLNNKPMFIEKELLYENSDWFCKMSANFCTNTRACGYTKALATLLVHSDVVVVVEKEQHAKLVFETAEQLILDSFKK